MFELPKLLNSYDYEVHYDLISGFSYGKALTFVCLPRLQWRGVHVYVPDR
jgi:hypothetical protein